MTDTRAATNSRAGPRTAETTPHRATVGAWLTLAVVAGGLFLAVMSTTVVSVALPTIGTDLDASPTDLEWIVDAYVVVYASLLLPGGALGDRLGRKGLFLSGVGLFGLGSAITALAPSVVVLLVGRVIQGLGPALLVPGSLTIIRATFENPRQRALAIGLWSTASGLALAVGPALGGLIVEHAGWRWVFGFNVPLAAVLVAVAAHFVPRLGRTTVAHRFDWAGATLSTGAIAALAFAVIEGQSNGWASPEVLGAFALGAGAGAAFLACERRLASPLIDVSLFTRPAFAAANLAAFVIFFAFVGAIVYFSAYFQAVQGHSPVSAGFDVAAIGIAYAVATVIAGKLVGRIGERVPLVVGLVIAGAATLGLLRLQAGTGIGAIWWNFALLGAGVGLCSTPMSTIAMSAVEVSRAGMASAVVNSLRQVGQVFGVAVLGALVYAHLPGSGSGGRLNPNAGSLFINGLHNAVWVSGLALLAAAVVVAVLFRRSRRHPAQSPPRSRADTSEEWENAVSADSVDFEEFMTGREAIGQAYITGDARPLTAISARHDPATYFSPQGDHVQGAADVQSATEDGAAQFAPGGDTQFEILHMSATGELGYWVGIQHANVQLEGQDYGVAMHLRVTEIYRREDGSWKLIHRHADPHASPTDG